MSAPDNPPAFPVMWDYAPNESGMTLRDWFAGQALGAIANIGCGADLARRGTAAVAYQLADAMLAERAKVRP